MATATRTIVVAGVSGSGKTSVMQALARRLAWPTLEGDDVHPAGNVAKMRQGVALTDADREPWLAVIASWIGEREAAGSSAIVSCSALRRAYRDRLRSGHPSVRFALLHADRHVLLGRMAHRSGHFMPATLLDSQLATLEPLGPHEPGATFDAERSIDELAAAIATRLAGD